MPEDFSADHSPEGSKCWKDIWSAAKGAGLVHDAKPIGAIVEDLVREAHDTLHAFG